MTTPTEHVNDLIKRYGGTRRGIWILMEALKRSAYPNQMGVELRIAKKEVRESPRFSEAR